MQRPDQKRRSVRFEVLSRNDIQFLLHILKRIDHRPASESHPGSRLFGFERGVGQRWRGWAPESGVTSTESVEVPGGGAPTHIRELIVGLGDVEVLGVDDESAGPLATHVWTRRRAAYEACVKQ